ncbi:MAG TPA: FeoB-associated Cys-rich membrane protein [Bacteroidia bacterium]
MNLQEIAVMISLAAAVGYLVYRTRETLRKKDCSKGCGCAGEIVKHKNHS